MNDKIINYFKSIGIDTNYSDNDGVSIYEFDIDFNFLKANAELIILSDEGVLNLNIGIDDVFVLSEEIMVSINDFNKSSRLYKAYYSDIEECIIISASSYFINDIVTTVIERLLNELINIDVEYLNTLYQQVEQSLKDSTDFDDEDLEYLKEFIDIDKF